MADYIKRIKFEFDADISTGTVTINNLSYAFEYFPQTFGVKIGPGSADTKAAGAKVKKRSAVGFRDAMATALTEAIISAQNLDA